MGASPKVSVLMSVYNGEPYLRESIDSILDQTIQDFEFIIINDASTDRTPAILDEYQKKDRRIIILSNETNLGLAASLNRGLLRARGEFIARQDDDDISMPDRLELELAYMESNRKCGILGGGSLGIETDGSQAPDWLPPETDRLIRWVALFSNPFVHAAILLRKAVLDKFNLCYNENLACSQDYDLWTRLLPHCEGHNLQKYVVQRRAHLASISQKRRDEQAAIAREISKKQLDAIAPNREFSDEVMDRLRCLHAGLNPGSDAKDLCMFHDVLDLYELFAAQYPLPHQGDDAIKQMLIGRSVSRCRPWKLPRLISSGLMTRFWNLDPRILVMSLGGLPLTYLRRITRS